MKKLLFPACLIIFFIGLQYPGAGVEKAPSFQTTDHQGNIVDSKNFLGEKPTILIFWAQWCVFCRKELPELSELYRKYNPKGLQIVAINRDNPDDQGKVEKYLQELNAPFPIVKPKRIPYKYKALTIPFLVAINAKGEIIGRGFSLSAMQPVIDSMLEKL